MTDRRRARHAGWPGDDEDEDPDMTDQDDPAPGDGAVTIATPPGQVLVIPVDGRDEPITVTSGGVTVPAELVHLVRTAAAASGLALSETP